MPTATPRAELGAFLRRKRAALPRAEFDLPPAGRSKTVGLRREEIAFLSGVSVTWYTWLEQGRDINPSRQVLDAVAVNLRLTKAEHDYVLGLCGFSPSVAPEPVAPNAVPAQLQLLLDALNPAPAFALTPHWDIAAWNSAYERLFPGVATVDPTERNLLVLLFTDDAVRNMLPDWERTSRQFLADYRAEAAGRIAGADHARLIGHLRHTSAEFATAWDAFEVERFDTRTRTFVHPVDGERVFEQLSLSPQGMAGLRVITYLPASDG